VAWLFYWRKGVEMKRSNHFVICKFFVQLIVGIVLLSFCNISYSAPKYQILDIHVAGTETSPRAINDHSQIVGGAHNGSYWVPFIWENGSFVN